MGEEFDGVSARERPAWFALSRSQAKHIDYYSVGHQSSFAGFESTHGVTRATLEVGTYRIAYRTGSQRFPSLRLERGTTSIFFTLRIDFREVEYSNHAL
jgi:hypothetical protein